MKFINPEKGRSLLVDINEESGVVEEYNKKGSKVNSIDLEGTPEEMTAKALVMAESAGFIPEIMIKVKEDIRVLQGSPFPHTAQVKISQDERVSRAREYFEIQEAIGQVEADGKADIDKIKKDVSSQVSKKTARQKELMPSVISGYEQSTFDASWERDVENGMMIMVRQSDLVALQIRPMDEHEQQLDLVNDAPAEGEEGQDDGKE